VDRDHALSILAEARLAERLVGSELAARLALLATFDPQRLGDEPDADDVVRLLCRRLPARDGRQVAMLDDRWRIEAAFCRLKDFRRVATRYDKLAANFASAVALAAVIAFWC